MKRNHLFLWNKVQLGKLMSAFCLCLFLIGIISCQQGFKDDERFLSEVSGVTLESPKTEDVKTTPSTDGSTLTVSWPVIYGAGGYEFSLYIVDDPANPVAVGEENEIVDGCSVKRELLEDTKYQVSIRTLGNERYNNKDASATTIINYATLVEAEIIPANTNLTEYFGRISLNDGDTYELEGNATYTISGDIDFGNTAITLRGDKVFPPTVSMDGSFSSNGAGMVLKFINFNIAEGSTKPFVKYGTPDASYTNDNKAKVFVLTERKLAIQSCNIYGLGGQFIYDGGNAYGFETVLVKNTKVFLAPNINKVRTLDVQKSLIVYATIDNCTFADPSFTHNVNFFQTGNSRPENAGYLSCFVTYTNNTFYGISKANNMFNYGNCYNQSSCTVTMKKNILYETGNKSTYEKSYGSSSTQKLYGNNAYYWSDSSIVIVDTNNPITVNPAFTTTPNLSASPSTWTFIPTASEIVSNQCGDLNWYNN